MELSSCPICFRSVPSHQPQRHANDHFADEDKDYEFAHQIDSIPPTPSQLVEDSLESTSNSWDRPQSSFGDAKGTSCGEKTDGEKYQCLVCSLNKEIFYRVEGGLMTLLKKCLELEPEKGTSVLCGHIDHFQSIESWDVGWGCGWRNIQMLSSYLLSQREEARDVLFVGSGFVPNIETLQRWLELAWENGFDAAGSNDFDRKIYGKRNWIGTTECAALLRSFGLRARIVDFPGKECELASSVSSLGYVESKSTKVYGPMDTFLSTGKLDSSAAASPGNELQKYPANPSVKAKGPHQVLMEWVWNYFSGENPNRGNHHVVLSEKSPLYFQHDGHSRTIVGIQAKYQRNGMQQYNLLVFDPAQRTKALETSLRENSGWQKFIKRGAHTLKKPQYQLCFIDTGIAHGLELEELKTLHSIRAM